LILVSTVWHTGTHSLVKHRWGDAHGAYLNDEIRWLHCIESVKDLLPVTTKAVTTYRQPERVAAAWINRNKKQPCFSSSNETGWMEQWRIWAKIIVPMAEVVSVNDLPVKIAGCEDRWQLHQYIEADDWKSYYEIVPKWAVEYAQNYVDQVLGYLPENLITK